MVGLFSGRKPAPLWAYQVDSFESSRSRLTSIRRQTGSCPAIIRYSTRASQGMGRSHRGISFPIRSRIIVDLEIPYRRLFMVTPLSPLLLMSAGSMISLISFVFRSTQRTGVDHPKIINKNTHWIRYRFNGFLRDFFIALPSLFKWLAFFIQLP